ncbi:MAG: tRNA (guanosine(37)-N1)-methyltransferase TrmD, partial [Erysipelotrichia bacterium]|nr:tRNA (guanosine(37)-N1)-methyltransferase TrmD [Erysipelotrichia bacterium]
MRITILTLFPEMFEGFLSTSIIARAISRGLVQVDFVNYRDFAHDTYKHVDDSPFGGGAGMVMKCQPVLDALNSVRTENSHVILMAPAGRQYEQSMAHEYASKEHLIILCGHYEGMDARIYDHVDELISIGDYVLTGGELASMVISDSVIRLLKGSIKDDSANDESYENGLLEYPQYTQPADYN